MWQVVTQKDVLQYEKVQEFVGLVTQAVPGLMGFRQRAQLILGLRARLVLELCRDPVNLRIVQPHLERLPTIFPGSLGYRDEEVESAESTFVALVQSLLKDPSERAYFFQEVFPVEYGPKYDSALQVLLWEFLSKLERLFPIPDIKQTAAWLSSAPSVLEDYQSNAEDLHLIHQHHMNSGLVKTPGGPSSSVGNHILSALSIPPSQRVVLTPQQTAFAIGPEAMHNYANILNPISYVGVDSNGVVTVYTEVEVGATELGEEIVESTNEVQAAEEIVDSINEVQSGEEIVESTNEVQSNRFSMGRVTVVIDADIGDKQVSAEAEEMETPTAHKKEQIEDAVGITEALQTLTKTFALKKDAGNKHGQPVEIQVSEVVSSAQQTAAEMVESVTREGNTREHIETPIEEEPIDQRKTLTMTYMMEEVASVCAPDVVSQQSDVAFNNGSKGQRQDETTPVQTEDVEFRNGSPGSMQLKDKEEPVCADQENESLVVTVSSETRHTKAVASVRRSTRLQIKTTRDRRQKRKNTPSETKKGKEKVQKVNNADVSVLSSVIGVIKGNKTDDSEEVTSIIFSCPQCPYHKAEENSPPHIHMQNVLTEEYKRNMGNGSNEWMFTPSPSGTDQIFTSIKLFPSANSIKIDPPGIKFPSNADGDTLSSIKGKQKSLTCETCGKTFTRTSDVRRHQLTHTGERPFRCSRCDRTFQHSWDVAKHESKHHGTPTSFPCQQCGMAFPNLRSLTVHHRKSHRGESELPQMCSICGESFPTAQELQLHKKSHGASLRYICQQCGEGFDSLLARSQHRQTHQSKRQFKCSLCDNTYTRRADVKRHLASHTGERPHQCGQCGKRFSLRFMLKKHLKLHTGERPFECSHCAKRFTLVSILARHERMHTGERPFLCSQCGKGFLSQGELSKHHRSHVDDRPYPCRLCEKRFKSKRAQQEHILSHSGARPYPCSFCGKGFSKPYALTRHHLMHTGERPFPCVHCPKTFLTLGEKQLHERIHTGERPYPCSVCEMKFKSSSELARHKRCHAGVRPARPNCQLCSKTFTSHTKLREHIEVHMASAEADIHSTKTKSEQTEVDTAE